MPRGGDGTEPADAAGRQGLPPGLRVVPAANPSPLTLDGTRTYLVGRARVAVIDPGPADTSHLDALTGLLEGAEASILVTHGHPDHAEAAPELARRVGGEVRSVEAGTLAQGDQISTDAGRLLAVATPGHTPDHMSFYWPASDALFCGDLMMGGETTALVAPPEGDLGEYLDSLERIRALAPRLILPAHGPPIGDTYGALEAYLRHRADRLAAVRAALEPGPATIDELVDAVYGQELDASLRPAAGGAMLAYLEYLRDHGLARADGGRWAGPGGTP
jgi:glyoxylase-like metal-dependent hydrolase (beta-lactamase superfamily II)